MGDFNNDGRQDIAIAGASAVSILLGIGSGIFAKPQVTATNLTAAGTALFVWGASQKGTPVQMNVIGTVMFLVSFVIIGLAQFVAWRRRRAKA